MSHVVHNRNHRGHMAMRGGAYVAGKIVRAVVNHAAKVKFPKRKTTTKAKKVQKTEDMVNLDAGHSGIGKDTIKINENKGGLKLFKSQSAGATWRYQQTHRQLITGVAGVQTVADICTVNGISQCLTSNGSTFTFYQNCVALKQLNPYLVITGSSYAGGGVQPLNDRFVIKNNSLNMEITNFTNVGAIVDIYICKCKKLSKDSPGGIWNIGANYEGIGQPAMTNSAPGNAALGAPGYLTQNVVGVKPNSVSMFRDYWKTVAVKNITLAPASTEILNVDILINKVIKNVDLSEQNATGLFFQPCSYSVMLVARGALVLDTTTAGFQIPTYGPVKVGVVITSHTQCAGVKGGNANRIATNTGVTTVPIGAVTANTIVINEVDTQVNPLL